MCIYIGISVITLKTYINNSFFLGVRLQVEKNVTFTLNFHMYCNFDVQAHIDVITKFSVGYKLCLIICSVFIKTVGGGLLLAFLFSFTDQALHHSVSF